MIHTPTTTVTDLGTEFGVEVKQDGSEETHVFDGAVKVTSNHVVGERGEEQIVRAGSAVRFDGTSKRGVVTKLGKSGFVCELKSRSPTANVAANAYAALVLSLRPVCYYRMERPAEEKERLVVFDSAPGGHHGLLHIDKAFLCPPRMSGRFGDAMWFRGPLVGDHVIVPDYPKAEHNQLSVSAWVLAVNRAACGAVAGNWTNEAAIRQFCLGLYHVDGDLSVLINGPNGTFFLAREGNPFPLNKWQHVAFVVNGGMVRLYRNGVEVGQSSCLPLLNPPLVRKSLGIGCLMSNADKGELPGYWNGGIDELAIFNCALSTDDIRRLCENRYGQSVKQTPEKQEASPVNK